MRANAAFPKIDGRQTSHLRADLLRDIRALIPDWQNAKAEIGPDRALVEIAARLAEHATRRLDQTPLRDTLAFYDMLDIPADEPKAAEALFAFTLTEKRDRPVIAQEGTQIGVESDGEQVIFETDDALMITPARIGFLAAVDADGDRLERAPTGVTAPAPLAEPVPHFRVAALATAGARTLQVTPGIGLAAGDRIRVDGLVYDLADVGEAGVLTLDQPLSHPALPFEPADDQQAGSPGSSVEKVLRFDSFDMRNRQEHALFIGHEDLFQLDMGAEFTLAFQPSSIASQLAALDLEYSTWGVHGDGDPDWQPLTCWVRAMACSPS